MDIKSSLFQNKVICAVGGGKGGVGKSIITSNIAIALARLGKSVIAVDADFGGANLHTVLGVNYTRSGLNDFMSKSVTSLKDILIDTGVENLKFISNASDILNLANPKFLQKEKLLKHIQKLEADFILLDLGAGASYNTLDFFGIADIKLVVACPEPTSVQNVYGFLKNAIYRKLIRSFPHNSAILNLLDRAINPNHPERIGSMYILYKHIEAVDRVSAKKFKNILQSFRPATVINMIESSRDKVTLETMRIVIKKYLNLDIDFLGSINYDPQISKSVKEMKPFLLYEDKTETSLVFYQITQNLLKCAARFGVKDNDSIVETKKNISSPKYAAG